MDSARRADEVLYLYCLAQPSASVTTYSSGENGEREVERILCQDIVAVVSHVRAEEFCGPEAEAKMADLTWMGPRVCRHEKVVEQTMHLSPVIPARFATLFSSPERLVGWLSANHDVIAGALDRFAEHQEWSVKGTLNEPEAVRRILAAARSPEGAVRSLAPGRNYLEERRKQGGARQELRTWTKGVCALVSRDLGGYAEEFREREIGSDGGADPRTTRILNWAFLVHQHRVDAFSACLERLNVRHGEQGLAFQLSGPWPPYSFSPSLERDATP
jgi:hypothetical protein